MKMVVFWDVAPCSPVEIDPRFSNTSCLHHQGDDHFKREAAYQEAIVYEADKPSH
jgi:hypothetical protein